MQYLVLRNVLYVIQSSRFRLLSYSQSCDSTSLNTIGKMICILRHNGLTSFTPPCFCWEVYTLEGEFLTKSADLDLSVLKFSKQQEENAIARLRRAESSKVEIVAVNTKSATTSVIVIEDLFE